MRLNTLALDLKGLYLDTMDAKTHRKETDSMGEQYVLHHRLWGAQTERSLKHFAIGDETMPKSLIHSFGLLKWAAAETNRDLKKLPSNLADLISEASKEVAEGAHDEHFPLRIWQTGSGTQTNMNANEVIANRSIQMAGGILGGKDPIHPNDHVNMSQSSNDVFPTSMHIAAALEIENRLLPSLHYIREALYSKEKEFNSIIKIGRTHLMDAVPLTLGQEFSGYRAQIDECIEMVQEAKKGFYPLAIGGTAVGTGLNAPKGFAEKVAEKLSKKTGIPFTSSKNKFLSLSSHNAFVFASGALKALACALTKIANDIRLMGSGPRCGFGELTLPENEPGSSIMPGKVNPTQCEALTMIAAQVMGNDCTIAISASQGHFELNVYKPVIILNFLQSVNLLSDGMKSFTDHLLKGLKANKDTIEGQLQRSLMLITALSPELGYDTCAKIAHKAFKENKSLKEVCVEMKLLTAEEFDKKVRPEQMLGEP